MDQASTVPTLVLKEMLNFRKENTKQSVMNVIDFHFFLCNMYVEVVNDTHTDTTRVQTQTLIFFT